jgi:hypothetical protein
MYGNATDQSRRCIFAHEATSPRPGKQLYHQAARLRETVPQQGNNWGSIRKRVISWEISMADLKRQMSP